MKKLSLETIRASLEAHLRRLGQETTVRIGLHERLCFIEDVLRNGARTEIRAKKAAEGFYLLEEEGTAVLFAGGKERGLAKGRAPLSPPPVWVADLPAGQVIESLKALPDNWLSGLDRYQLVRLLNLLSECAGSCDSFQNDLRSLAGRLKAHWCLEFLATSNISRAKHSWAWAVRFAAMEAAARLSDLPEGPVAGARVDSWVERNSATPGRTFPDGEILKRILRIGADDAT